MPIFYAAAIATGLMTHQLTRWLRQLPVDADLTLDLIDGKLLVNQEFEILIGRPE